MENKATMLTLTKCNSQIQDWYRWDYSDNLKLFYEEHVVYVIKPIKVGVFNQIQYAFYTNWEDSLSSLSNIKNTKCLSRGCIATRFGSKFSHRFEDFKAFALLFS